MTNRNQGLDILRALAIIMVVLLHLNQSVQGLPLFVAEILNFGWSGVDLFFVLSGFLIARQVYSEKEGLTIIHSLRNFWLKRWLRTLPLYYSAVFVYAVIKPMIGFPFVDWQWKFLYFAQNYFVLNDFVQSWSLCIEEQFYLFFPILFYLFRFKKLPAYIWIIPMLISVISRWIIYSSGALDIRTEPLVAYTIRFVTHNHLDGISLGVFLAATFPRWINFTQKTRTIMGIVGALLVIITLYISGHALSGSSIVYSFALTSIGYCLLLIAMYKIKLKEKLFRPINKIALWSYGTYIWNHLIVRGFDHIEPMPWWIGGVVFVIISFGIAAITYKLIELPFLNIRKKILSKLG